MVVDLQQQITKLQKDEDKNGGEAHIFNRNVSGNEFLIQLVLKKGIHWMTFKGNDDL